MQYQQYHKTLCRWKVGPSPPLLERFNTYGEDFLIFAGIGEGRFGCLRVSDGTIWYEESDGLRQVGGGLDAFMEDCLRDAEGLA